MKKADVYFVCSTKEAADEMIAQITSFVELRGGSIGKVFYDRTDRIASRLSLLMKYSDCSECSWVVVPEYEMLGSDEFIRLENEIRLKRNGVRLTLMQKRNGVTMYDRYLNEIMKANNHGVSWQVERGELNQVAAKRALDGATPYGYNRVDGRLVINPTEAGIVREIYDMYINGESVMAIGRKFDGVRTKRGSFTRNSIPPILSNPRYAGIDGGVCGAIPAIITNKQWLSAQCVRRSRLKKQSMEHVFLLDNVVCAAYRRGRLLPVQDKNTGERPKYILSATDVTITADAMEIESAALKLFYTRITPRMDELCADVLAHAEAKRRSIPRHISVMESLIDTLKKQYDAAIMASCTGVCACAQSRLDQLKWLIESTQASINRAKTEMRLYTQPEQRIRDFFDRAKWLYSLDPIEQRYYLNIFIFKAIIRRTGVLFKFRLRAMNSSLSAVDGINFQQI